MARGNLDVQVDAAGDDEVAVLAHSFNQMVSDLKTSRKELEKYSKDLEKEVEKRTEELNKRVEELEKINRIAIDRELRMIELKKRIKELEGKE